jgi:predicted TIM-barrel fold metal-dependent hydrolase
VLTEQGTQWVPGTLARMDQLWERMVATGRIGELGAPEGAITKRKASEYFADNVWMGASFPGPADAEVFREIGIDKVMWGSDYPHDEGTYPKTRESLRAAFSGWTESELRTIFSENIAKVYDFDLDALAPLAAQFGPTVEEIATPLPV